MRRLPYGVYSLGCGSRRILEDLALNKLCHAAQQVQAQSKRENYVRTLHYLPQKILF